ncbi:acyltransferase [Clostridium saccharoperbutylacetonicum]|jgi:acetyltransferase-like isoleucine patch superfamily enzyme
MIGKIVKYLKSFIRIIIFKLKFGKKIKFKLANIKSLYIGKNVKIKINMGCKLCFGENAYIEDFCRIECLKGNIYIGGNTFLNTNCNLIALVGISIGEDCLLGSNIGIYDHDHRYDMKDLPITKQGFTMGKIKIEDNVWIGSNCTITKGVNIKSRVIVAANSVVTKNLEAKGIYGGVPSKLIKKL